MSTIPNPTDAEILAAVADALPDEGAWPNDWHARVDAALSALGLEVQNEYYSYHTVAWLSDGRRVVEHDESVSGPRRYRITLDLED